jgi:hypothetical protein
MVSWLESTPGIREKNINWNFISKDETAAGFLHCGPQLTVEARKG